MTPHHISPKLARNLTSLYPRPWRNRFAAEFEDLLLESPATLSTIANVIAAAFYEHLSPSQRSHMDPDPRYPRLQSFCTRAPWLVFSLGPLLLLALLWCISLGLLWSGWMMFLPGADTPFGTRTSHLISLANFYFQADRLIYFSAPILTGWAILLLTIRLRLKLLWPSIGLLISALIGGLARVQAGYTAFPHNIGHMRIGLTLGSTMPLVPYSLIHSLILLVITAVPYLLWRQFRGPSAASA